METDKQIVLGIEEQLTREIDDYLVIALNRALPVVKNAEVAAEIAQEAIFRLLEKVRKGDGLRNMRGFLSQVAWNLAIDHYYLRQRYANADEWNSPTLIRARDTHMDEEPIRRCLQERLTPKQYEVFLPRFQSGLDSEQIAKLLGKSRKYVQDLLAKAKPRAKACLGGYLSDPA